MTEPKIILLQLSVLCYPAGQRFVTLSTMECEIVSIETIIILKGFSKRDRQEKEELVN